MIALLLAACLFFLVFSVSNYRRAENERKQRQQLEEESATFHNVLLEHLADWKYWKDEKDSAERCLSAEVLRGKIMRDALEYISVKPQYPKIKDGMVEIPGETCQRARDALLEARKVR